MKNYYFGVFAILLLSATVLSPSYLHLASAQEASEALITVNTPDKSYDEGDTIVITGKVSTVIVGTPVTIQIFHKETLVEVRQIGVAQDGSFTETVLAEGPQWKSDGEYTVRAAYGQGRIAETTFTFSTQKDDIPITDIFEVDAGSSGTFDVEYTITSGEVTNMKIVPDMFALSVTIEPVDDGSMTMSLPREYIDAKKQGGGDEEFIVLVDGSEVPYETVKKSDESRIIKVLFDEDTTNIQIIGTYVIPEFGVLSLLVFAATIGSAIAVMFFVKRNNSKIMCLAR